MTEFETKPDKTTVAGVWEWLFEAYHLERARVDRARLTGTKPGEGPAVEVGYGSYTVRVRVYDGTRLEGFVDLDSRENPKPEKLADVRALMDRVGMVKR